MDLWTRYLSKTDVRGTYECWEWTAGTDKDGYGIFSWREDSKSFTVRATRWGWKQRFGDIPPGQMVCHTCDNPPCQNPTHWFLDDAAGNNRDCIGKGRARVARGETHYKAVLTNAQVEEIRARFTGRFGEIAEIGREYGVHRKTISKIVNGQQRTP